MHVSSRLSRVAGAAFACSVAVAQAAPPTAHRGALPAPSLVHRAEDANADDEGLLFEDDPVIRLDRSARSWMKLETDPCGFLQGIRNSGGMVTRSGFAEDSDDGDDADPSQLGQEMIGRWLSGHSEIAVVSDGVDKSCDSDAFESEGLPDNLAPIS